MKFSNLCFTWSTYGLFVVILGNVFPDLEIRMSEHALKVSCGPQPIALVPFGQLPHELAVLYVHWKYFIKKDFSLGFKHFQKVSIRIRLVPFGFGQLPHELAILRYYTSTENILSKKITLALFQKLNEVLGLKEKGCLSMLGDRLKD